MPITGSEARNLLWRIKHRETTEEDVDIVEGLLDDVSQHGLISTAKEAVEAIVTSNAVEMETQKKLDKIIALLETRKQLREFKIEKLWVPIVTGLIGIATTLSAAWAGWAFGLSQSAPPP